jgi:hypothetical protein
MFRKLELFPSSVEGRETPTLLGPLERANLNQCIDNSSLIEVNPFWGPNRIGVSLLSPENGNKSSF